MTRTASNTILQTMVWATASALALLLISSRPAAAQITINDGTYPTDTKLNADDTASGTLTGLGEHENVTFDFSYSVTGTAQWAGGVQFQNPSGLEQLWTQNRTTDFDGDVGVFEFDFSASVDHFTVTHGGLDVQDTVRIEAFLDGVAVPVLPSYFDNFTGGVNIQATTANTVTLIGPSGGNADETANQYRLTFPTGVKIDELNFIGAKFSDDSNNVTLAFYNFEWDANAIVATNDSTTGINSSTGGTAVVNAFAGDTVDGDPATSSNAILSVAAGSSVPSGLIFDTATGNVDVVPGTVPGIYLFNYQLCEAANSTNCATAQISVTVEDIAVAIAKISEIHNASSYALPGNDIIYTITVTNQGGADIDANSLLVVDALPDTLSFFNGDMNDGDIGSDAVLFVDNGSSISFNATDDVGYSDALTAPASLADCDYAPSIGYDSNIRYICFNPKGVFPAGDPDPNFSLQFRARIE